MWQTLSNNQKAIDFYSGPVVRRSGPSRGRWRDGLAVWLGTYHSTGIGMHGMIRVLHSSINTAGAIVIGVWYTARAVRGCREAGEG
jgi:hypothetical protein